MVISQCRSEKVVVDVPVQVTGDVELFSRDSELWNQWPTSATATMVRTTDVITPPATSSPNAR